MINQGVWREIHTNTKISPIKMLTDQEKKKRQVTVKCQLLLIKWDAHMRTPFLNGNIQCW